VQVFFGLNLIPSGGTLDSSAGLILKQNNPYTTFDGLTPAQATVFSGWPGPNFDLVGRSQISVSIPPVGPYHIFSQDPALIEFIMPSLDPL